MKLGTSATSIYKIIYETFEGSRREESCGVTWKSEKEFLKLGTSTMYIIYFKGGSGVEFCGNTWKSEEEFLNLSTSVVYIVYETFKGRRGIDRVLRYYLEVRGGILEVWHINYLPM